MTHRGQGFWTRVAAPIGLALALVVMTAEEGLARQPVAPDGEMWVSHLRAMNEAYRAALGTRTWEGMLAVGEASLRLGRAAHQGSTPRAEARRAYLTALFRARGERSLPGVLRTGEAFAALGDRDAVAQSIHIAESLPAYATDPRAVEPLRGQLDRLTERRRAARGMPRGGTP